MVNTTEILIVGAGPAGSTLGRHLATKGREVTIIDKATFPRRKVCGGGIPQRTERLLDCDWTRLTCGTVNEVILQGNWGRKIDIKAAPVARVVDRAEFDNYLLGQAITAGAKFEPETRVTGVYRENHLWTVKSSDGQAFSAPILCACDGANSRIVHLTNAPRQPSGIALEGFLQHENYAPTPQNKCAIFHLACIRGGYGWSFPKSNGYNLGIGTHRTPSPDIKSRLSNLVQELHPEFSASDKGRLDDVQGAPLPFYSRTPSWFAQNNLYLVGDAAGLVDPLTGEGIFYAIQSAIFCAEAIAKGGESRYNELVAGELAADLEVAAHYAHKAAYIPGWLISLFLGRERYRKYAEYFVEMLAGRITYRELYARMHGGRN